MLLLTVVGIFMLGAYVHAYLTTRPGPYTRRVAVLGTTPAGIAAAFRLSRGPHRVNITLLTPHAELAPLWPATYERARAAGFLARAANEIGLRAPPPPTVAGVYDGRSWAFAPAHPRNAFERAWEGFLWWTRFGRQPGAAARAAADARAALLGAALPFESVAAALHASRIADDAAHTAADTWFDARGVGGAYQRELMNGLVRRGAQNLAGVSGLAAAVALADTVAAPGLWEGMVAASGADVRTRTDVVSVRRGWWGRGWVLGLRARFDGAAAAEERFDAVVVADAWAAAAVAGVAARGAVRNAFAAEAWITTFSSDTGELRGAAFPGKGRHGAVPDTVLTTPCSWEYREVGGRSGLGGLGHAPFWSLERGEEQWADARRTWTFRLVSAWEFSDAQVRALVEGEVGEIVRVYVGVPSIRPQEARS